MLTIKSFTYTGGLKNDFHQVAADLYDGDPIYREPGEWPLVHGDGRCFVAYRNGKACGRIAAIINPGISHVGEKTGLVGYFECEEYGETAKHLLEAAVGYLRVRGCSRCLGPMNGNTWQSYRLSLPAKNPPFFLDNYHKPYYHKLFVENGFTEAASYISTGAPRGRYSFDRLSSFEKVLEDRGIIIRNFNLRRFDEDLRVIFNICLQSFAANLYYTPISWEEFKSMYENIKPLIKDRFVLLAETADSKPLGFVFAVPNLYAPENKSLVIKTVAVVPGGRAQGLGAYLVELIHKAAFDAGFEEVIHALMQRENISTRIGAQGSRPLRNYALMVKEI